MSPAYRHAIVALAVVGTASVLVWTFVDAVSASLVLAAGALGLLAYHVVHLARLERWLSRPAPGKVPEGRGIWERVLTALHRFEREAARREDALSDTLVRLRRAAQVLPDGVVILDAERRIEWCNRTAEAQLQLDGRADAGQPIANLVREPQFLAYLEQDEHGAGPVRIERGEGIALSLQLIPYAGGQTLLLSRDVTQAERLDTMRRDFVANVSHELRTPLTVLVGFLETVRELELDPQRLRHYLRMMDEQAARMHRIIEDLLTLSVLESAPPPPADRVRMRPLLERLLEDAKALSAGRHTVLLDGAPAADIAGAEQELASAFGNLVSNAVRYTPPGGTITLSWREDSDGARFTVVDTGVGIAPEHLPRLTERFYRVDRSRSRETGGTGLGLAIVKHALARHDAALEISSEPGKGSRFTVRFPAARTVPPSR